MHSVGFCSSPACQLARTAMASDIVNAPRQLSEGARRGIFCVVVLRRRCRLVHLSNGTLRRTGSAMDITPFFPATSNLRGELKVDRFVPSIRTCVHSHPAASATLSLRYL